MKPLVSLIIPVYNVEFFLERCLNSIIKQTYENLQIIIINDGSTDKSLDIANKYKLQDNRIILIDQSNQGQAKARNAGLDYSSGEYVMFVDSDDWLALDCVEECLKAIEKNNSDIVIFDARIIKINYEVYEKYGLNIYDCQSAPWNKMYKKEIWNEMYFPEDVWYEDLGIIPIIVGLNLKKVKLNKALYYYDYTRAGSQSHQLNHEKNFDIIKVLDLVYNALRNSVNINEVEYLYIKHLLYGLILRKLLNTKNPDKRLIEKVFNIMNKKFPRWEKNPIYISDKTRKRIIERFIINLLNKKRVSLASLLWRIVNIIYFGSKKINTLRVKRNYLN